MSESDKMPASELEARRERLLALKAKAAGIKRTTPVTPSPDAAPSTSANGAPGEGGDGQFSGDRTKYFATFLLNTLKTKPEGDDEPKMVPGTVFTEHGLEKLLEGLKERSELMGAQGKGLMKRFHDFLTAPASDGQQFSHGVNLEHLERFVNLLSRMQISGWDGVKKDFMSGDGKDMLEAFSKPRIDRLEEEIDDLKKQVAELRKEFEKPARKR